jgi:hypothetical protein
MIRKATRVRVKPRRKGSPSVAPEPEVLSAVLTADQIDLKAQLHEQAAQSVATTLTRMQQRTQQAARSTPELEPFLTAYFEAAGTSLLQNTLTILNDPPRVASERPVRPPRRPSWPFSIRRLIPVRKREEQPDGAA